jgi:hypothetical protein
MVDQGNEEIENEEIVTTEEQVAETTSSETVETTTETEDEYNEEFQQKVVGFFNKKGRQVENVDDLFKEQEVVEKIVEKEVDRYAGIEFDEEDLQYINYKKETGRSRKDFDALNKDVNTISPIELARQRIEKETGEKFSNEDTIEYLEDKFGIDLDDLENLTAKAKIELQGFVKPVKDEFITNQEKYKQPIEKTNTTQEVNENTVTLDNGTVLPKEEYEKQVASRENFLEQVNAKVNSVAKAEFKFEIEDNGVKKDVDFSYDFTDKDRQNMLSDLSDIDSTIAKRFTSENGIDVEGLGIALHFGTKEKLGKLLETVYQRGRADYTEEITKVGNNVNFNNQDIPNNANAKAGTKVMSINEIFNR